jgi:hypothetical protein
VRALIRACSAKAPTGIRNRALIALHRSGLRLAEALALHPTDVDPARGTVRGALRGTLTDTSWSANPGSTDAHHVNRPREGDSPQHFVNIGEESPVLSESRRLGSRGEKTAELLLFLEENDGRIVGVSAEYYRSTPSNVRGHKTGGNLMLGGAEGISYWG